MPLDLRVTAVATELYQFVTVGQTLLGGDGIERVEILSADSGRDVPAPAGPGR